MPLTCVAIDDEPLALELIRSYVSRIPDVKLLHAFEDAISGAEYLSKSSVDLVFLDINMPDISGVDLAKSLSQKPMVIFTTAHKQFAFDGFELEAIDYLLKPINFDRFSKAVFKAIDIKKHKSDLRAEHEEPAIFVHSEYKMIKVILRDIEYLESMEDYVKIHLVNDKPLLTLMSLKKMVEMLPEKQFKRIHRSYVAPRSKIKSIQQKRIKIGDVELPIGESYLEQVKIWLADR